MKLQEIREILEDLGQMRIGETVEDYSQRVWDSKPRIPYKKLPASLQKVVRQRFTPDTLLDFLRTCYAPLKAERVIKEMVKQGAITIEKKDESHYLSFETVTAGIPADAMENILMRTRNTATYTVEMEAPGQPAPMLYGNHAQEAFENAIDVYREHLEEKQRKQEELEKYEKAKAKAKKEKTKLPPKPQFKQRATNLVSAGNYQYVISDKKFQYALTTRQNNNAYIALMNADIINKLDFKQDGTLMYDNEIAGIVRQNRKGQYTDIQNLDFPLLTQIYTAAVKSNIRNDSYTITVSLPKFFQEMGIEISKGNAPDIMEKLHSFEECFGIMPGRGIVSRLLILLELDEKNQTLTFAIPYIMRLLETLDEKNHIEKTTKKGELIDYRKPYNHTLIYSNIGKERNKTAVELVYLIINGLVQRGYVPDIQTYKMKNAKTKYPERITYSIRFRTLINETQLLRGRIQSYEDMSNKNNALRRAFEKAYQLLEEKTDVKEWFINLKYNAIVPTMASLDDELIFTHEGKNGDYKPKKWGEVY